MWRNLQGTWEITEQDTQIIVAQSSSTYYPRKMVRGDPKLLDDGGDTQISRRGWWFNSGL